MGQGFHRRQAARHAADWERTRWQTWQLINIQLPPEDRLRSPEALMRLPTDAAPAPIPEPVGPPETKEELRARALRRDPDKLR